MNVVTNDQIIASAKMQLKIETTDDDIWFSKLVNEGVRHLDCLTIFKKKVKVLSVNNNMAELPCGFFQMIALRTGSGTNCSNAIYADLPFLYECGCAPGLVNVQTNQNVYEIQGEHIVFHPVPVSYDPDTGTFSEGVPITSCTIAYFGLNQEDGLFEIFEHYERALTAYVCWKYCQQNFERYPVNLRNEYMAEWQAQKKWVKSVDYFNNFRNTKRQIAEQVNAVLVDKVWLP